MTDCAYCGKTFRNVRAHEKKCKAVFDQVRGDAESATAEAVLAAKAAARAENLKKAREARSAKAKEAQMEKARALLDIPEQGPVETPAEPVEVAEPVPASPSLPMTPDWYSMY